MAMESVAGCPWNGWPNAYGISGRMAVEWVAESPWNSHPLEHFVPERRYFQAMGYKRDEGFDANDGRRPVRVVFIV